MIGAKNVTYKLTDDNIHALVEYHKTYCLTAKANACDWMSKEQDRESHHEDSIQAINKFVFRTHDSILEELEEGGTGELPSGESEKVKNRISSLLEPHVPL
ncbi:uncharacterized protein FFNC_15563 [Fusarium fujikuroi]|nr:uncharacterized protein FFNC_15563 [Fusarium fujikuroi]